MNSLLLASASDGVLSRDDVLTYNITAMSEEAYGGGIQVTVSDTKYRHHLHVTVGPTPPQCGVPIQTVLYMCTS